MQGSGTGSQAKVQHLSQNGYSLSLSLSLSFSSCLRMLCCKTRLDLCCQPSIMHSEGMLARMSSSCLQLGGSACHHARWITHATYGTPFTSRHVTCVPKPRRDLVRTPIPEILQGQVCWCILKYMRSRGFQHGLHRTSKPQCSRAVGMCPGTAVRGLQSFASVHLGSFRHTT